MNMRYISDTARNRTYNLFCPKREPIPLRMSQWRTSDGFVVRNSEKILGRGSPSPLHRVQTLPPVFLRFKFALDSSFALKYGVSDTSHSWFGFHPIRTPNFWSVVAPLPLRIPEPMHHFEVFYGIHNILLFAFLHSPSLAFPFLPAYLTSSPSLHPKQQIVRWSTISSSVESGS